jgi:hypothetical protein
MVKRIKLDIGLAPHARLFRAELNDACHNDYGNLIKAPLSIQPTRIYDSYIALALVKDVQLLTIYDK